MTRYIGWRGFDYMGRGMPELMTLKAKQYRDAFEKRLERLARASAESKGKASK